MADKHEDYQVRSFARWFICRVVPTFFSPYTSRSVFARKIGLGFRTGIAFAVSAALASRPDAVYLLGNPSWYVVFSVLFIRDTVGGTIGLIDSLYRCLTLTTVVDTAILASGIVSLPIIPLVVAVETILFATTVIYCYLFHDLQQKRYILSIHAVVLVQIANGDASLWFPAQLLCCMVLAAVGAIILVCLPYPRLASNELLDRWRLSMSSISEAMTEALAALESGHAEDRRVRVMHARFVLAGVVDNQPTLWRLQTETSREASVFRIFFPLSPGFRVSTLVDVGRCEEMHWIVSNMCDLVEHLHPSFGKHWASPTCRHAISEFNRVQKEWLALISSEDMSAQNEAAVVSGRIRVGAVFHALNQAILQTDEPNQRDHDVSSSVLLRSALAFQLRRWADAIVSLEVDAALSKEITPSHSITHVVFFSWKRLLSAQSRNPFAWSFFGLHPLRDLWRTLFEIFGAVRHPGLDFPRLKSSTKTALILCTTAMIAVVPPLQANWIFPEAVWAVYSYVNVISSNEGMLWGNSLDRLVGTFCGGILGYLVLLAFKEGWLGAIIALSVWNFGLVWLKGSVSNPASFSATIIVFGRHLSSKGNQLSPEDYALTRMIEIGIGVVIAALMSAVLFPVSSLHLIRQEWKGAITDCDEALKGMKDAYQQVVSADDADNKRQDGSQQSSDCEIHLAATRAPTTDKSKSPDDSHLESILVHSGAIAHSLSRQQDLLLNNQTEPVILMMPPPSTSYRALMESISTIWQDTLNLEAAARQLVLHRGLHGTASEADDAKPHARLWLPIIEAAWKQNHHILRDCIDVIDAPNRDLDDWDDAVELAEVRRLSEQLRVNLREVANPALGALLHTLMQLSVETICLRRKVQMLLKAERPKGFDD